MIYLLTRELTSQARSTSSACIYTTYARAILVLDNLKPLMSFSRRSYLMAIHEQLTRVLKHKLKEVKRTNASELAKSPLQTVQEANYQ
jgi:hypothetical protein